MDADAVADFLRGHLGRAVADLTPIGHGEWSRAYWYRSQGAEFVVRFSALPEDFLKDAHVARRASGRLSVPEIIDIGQALDGFYAISPRVRGRYLDDLDERAMRAALPSLLGSLDALRQVDVSDTNGFGIWDAHEQAPYASWPDALLDRDSDRPGARVTGWRETLADSPIAPAYEEAGARLAELSRDCPSVRHLVHADLLNFNVLVGQTRVEAILDWGSSLYGDFVFDIAWFTFWQAWYPNWARIDFVAEAQRHYADIGLEVPEFQLRLRCCELSIGLDNQRYSAFKQRWTQLEQVAARTLALARAAASA
jgi:hygromycin-B 4-O-kinase